MGAPRPVSPRRKSILWGGGGVVEIDCLLNCREIKFSRQAGLSREPHLHTLPDVCFFVLRCSPSSVLYLASSRFVNALHDGTSFLYCMQSMTYEAFPQFGTLSIAWNERYRVL